MNFNVPNPGTLGAEVDGIQIGTSIYGKPIPVVYGVNVVAGNIIWMPREFWTKDPGQPPSGKGGDAGTQDTFYQGFMMAICEGPVSLGRVWRDKEAFSTLSAIPDAGFSFFSGARTQAPWAFLLSTYTSPQQTNVVPVPLTPLYRIQLTLTGTSSIRIAGVIDLDGGAFRLRMREDKTGFPGQGQYFFDGVNSVYFSGDDRGHRVNVMYYLDTTPSTYNVPYGGTAYIAGSKVNLGHSNTIKNYKFEVRGFLSSNGANPVVNPADVISDYLLSTEYGSAWPSAQLDVLNGADGTLAAGYKTACQAQGFLLAPVFDEQKPMLEHLQDLCDASHAFMVGTADGKLRILPYSDTAITANGVTYTPALTPQYNLTNDNLVSESEDDAPVSFHRIPEEETFNCCPITFLDSQVPDPSSQYTESLVENIDQANFDKTNEIRRDSPKVLHAITRQDVAAKISKLRMQRSLGVRTTFTFKITYQHSRLEPGDIVTLTEVRMGLVNFPVRITAMEEDSEDTISVEAEELMVGVSTAPVYTTQTSQGGGQDQGADPLHSTPPAIVVPPIQATADQATPEVWIATAGMNKDWGGAQVWISWDGSSYDYVGDVGPGTFGVLDSQLTIGPPKDTSNVFRVDVRLSPNATLPTVPQQKADSLDSLCYVDGELLAYQTSVLQNFGIYALSNLNRGVLGTVANTHLPGSQFLRVDGAVLKLNFPVTRYGQTLYVKLASFNLSHNVVQDISTLDAYTYTLPPKNLSQLKLATIPFKILPDNFNLTDWDVLESPPGSLLTTPVNPGANNVGQTVIEASGGPVRLLHKTLIPYDAARVYKLTARFRQLGQPRGITFGFVGVMQDGVTLVGRNNSTTNPTASPHALTAAGVADGLWHDAVGYWQGRGAPTGTDAGNQATSDGFGNGPGWASTNVRYMRLCLYMNNPTPGAASALSGAISSASAWAGVLAGSPMGGRVRGSTALGGDLTTPVSVQDVDMIQLEEAAEAILYGGPPLATGQLADFSVTSVKIANGAVLANKVVAGAIQASHLALGVSANMLYPGAFTTGIPKLQGATVGGWTISWDAAQTIDQSAGNAPSVNLTATWALGATTDAQNDRGNNTAFWHQTNRAAASVFSFLSSAFLQVQIGHRYIASVYVGPHRCKQGIRIDWYNAAGTFISSTSTTANSEFDNGSLAPVDLQTIDRFHRIWAWGDAPAGAVQAKFVQYKGDTNAGSTDSWAFWARAMLEEAPLAVDPNDGLTKGPTVPSVWMPPAMTVLDQSGVKADALQTSNYSEDGSGNPTAGARMSSRGTALKLASGNFQLGPYLFDDGVSGNFWVRLRNALGENSGRVFYRGMAAGVAGSAAADLTLSHDLIRTVNWTGPAGALTDTVINFQAAPVSVDNMDALKFIKLDWLTTADAFLLTYYMVMNDRPAYVDGTPRGSAVIVIPGNRMSGTSLVVHVDVTVVTVLGFSSTTRRNGAAASTNYPDNTNLGGGGGGGGGSCPAPFTRIKLASGLWVPAGDLADGTRVASFDRTMSRSIAAVVRHPTIQWSERYDLALASGKVVTFSKGHRFATGQGWKAIHELAPGDKIVGLEGDDVVKTVQARGKGQVVAFQVEGASTYFSEGLASHNIKP